MNTMQRLRIVGLSLLLLTGISAQDQVKAQPGVSIPFQTFYNELAPYGRWINSPQYGSVWTPYVDRGFQPYSTNGYWEVTEFGNTWVSDYDWGWAAFHYGRWSYDDFNGWFWIPGYEWGPAWVNWRTGGEYYGWAPLGPGMDINISVNIPSFWWVFVPQRYIASRNWYNYCPPRNHVVNIYNQTTIINNYYRSNNRTYAYGPRRDEIERVTRRSVQVRQIDMNQRGRVITDRSRNSGYDAPNHDAPVYRQNGRRSANQERSNSDRYDNGSYNGRSGNGRIGNSGENPERSNSTGGRYESPDRTSPYSSPRQSSSPNSPAENGNFRTYEPARQSSTPGAEPSRGSGNSERSGRLSSPYQGDNSNSGRVRESAPAVRSAPAERSSAPREASPRSESRPDNLGGNSRSDRGSRSPR